MSSFGRRAFAVGAAAGVGVVALLVVTLTTGVRLWPPGERSWKYYLHWGLVTAYELSTLAVTRDDWDSWVVPTAVRFGVGVPLAVVGGALFVVGTGTLGADETGGVEGDLRTDGPYAYTRNPQYVGMILGRAGLVLLVNSRRVAVLGGLQVGWVTLLPFAEEPWLAERFGAEYERYRERVPRFVGRDSLP
ncbi:methyltransferase family protein [Candidatus Halobonum tyrrellensis]|uniref:Isoprenylcysteine carboxylmethyltransferase family protein n=1 Tax=Candidatus Halobonum tyrrellensis G22 TaxID=1324957 RepID=V4IZU3_9EURY|nr:isoprenylcysteine carboxylmethyltransferase family protein [Candidatus Halobonum tyrrellensis]ESP88672.1 hypothetical protein K933_07473 [Candidatus Halobonum tyrrellensis G22]